MTDDITTPDEPEADDGFSGSSRSGRVGKGSYLKWNDMQHWIDRDGLTPPSPLLVVAVNEIVRRWKDGTAEDIVDKPLPDPEQLNAAIPVTEWEEGIDGKPRPPWAHTVIVYLVHLATGETYTYAAATVGAHIAYDALKESVITMRALRGTKCMPLVNLSERPMKMRFGMGKRPHFQIIGWKTPGEDAHAIPVQPAGPQLFGPTVAQAETPSTPTEASPAQPNVTLNHVESGPTSRPTQPRQAKPKPPVNTGFTFPIAVSVSAVMFNRMKSSTMTSHGEGAKPRGGQHMPSRVSRDHRHVNALLGY
jgi:hypothetical protein